MCTVVLCSLFSKKTNVLNEIAVKMKIISAALLYCTLSNSFLNNRLIFVKRELRRPNFVSFCDPLRNSSPRTHDTVVKDTDSCTNTLAKVLRSVSRSASTKLSEKDLLIIINDIDTNLDMLDINSLSDSLLCISLISKQSSDRKNKYDEISDRIMNILFKSLNSELSSSLTPESFTSFLSGLSRTSKQKWIKLPPQVRTFIVEKLRTLILAESSQASFYLPEVMWSLGKLGVQWRLLSKDVTADIENCIEKTIDFRLNISKLLYALALMGREWVGFSVGCRQTFTHSIINHAHVMHEMGVSNILYALAKVRNVILLLY